MLQFDNISVSASTNKNHNVQQIKERHIQMSNVIKQELQKVFSLF